VIDKWDLRFMELARLVGTWSKDPSTKVGAVIVDNNRKVLGLGYNGFARGVEDTEERLNNRDLKYPLTIHAEINAISNAMCDLTHCTLYVDPLPTCSRCAAQIINSGITRVICAPLKDSNASWQSDVDLALMQFEEANVEVNFLELTQ